MRRRWMTCWRKPIIVLDNYYNHLVRDPSGALVIVSGVPHGRVAHPVHRRFARGRFVVELPHSGYLPAGVNAELNRAHWHTHAFVIELPEDLWRGIGGTIGCITSPDYFMAKGALLKPRAACDYQADLRLIRATIAASGLPATYVQSADEAIAAVRTFLNG